jgi:hypothetical protein
MLGVVLSQYIMSKRGFFRNSCGDQSLIALINYVRDYYHYYFFRHNFFLQISLLPTDNNNPFFNYPFPLVLSLRLYLVYTRVNQKKISQTN